MPDQYDVFLSHTSRDKVVVRKIAAALADAGLRVWFDEWSIRPGASWQSSFEEAIGNSSSAVVVLGKRGLGPWQQMEMRMALLQVAKDRRPVIPVFLPGVDPYVLPPAFAAITGVHIKSQDDHDFRRAVDQILWGVTGRLPEVPKAEPIPKVFLCHAKEDNSKVERLYFQLKEFGIDPWYDKEKLAVGDRWEQEILEAIENTDFFALCLSSRSVRKTGFIQREIRMAVKEYQRRPQQSAFLLPVRLEPCTVPKIKLDDTTTLSDFQWLDLFEEETSSLKRFAEGVKRQFEKMHATDT